MKISEAIERADKLLNNSYTEKQKTDWLAELDERILREIYESHERLCDIDEREWIIYLRNKFVSLYESAGKEMATVEETFEVADAELLLPMQYHEIYIYYLLYKYASLGGERERAENYWAEYFGLYTQFVNWVNRTFKPLQRAKITG